MALEPAWTGPYAGLINSYLFGEPKDFKQAELLSVKLAAMAPASAMPLVWLGDAYRAQNKLDKAEAEYSKALQINPASPAVYYKRGHIYTFLGHSEKARADYEKAGELSESPTSGRSYTALSYVYEGQPQKAIQLLLGYAEGSTKEMGKALAATPQSNYLNTAADIAQHTRDVNALQQVITKLTPVSEEMSQQIGTDEAKRDLKAGVLFWQIILKTLNKDFAGAKA